MPLTDTIVPYEILVRFAPDGTVQGAHVQRRHLVLQDGLVLLDQPLPAEPLGMADFPTSELMTEATAAALATVNRQAIQISSLLAQIGALEEANGSLAMLVDQLSAQLAQRQAA